MTSVEPMPFKPVADNLKVNDTPLPTHQHDQPPSPPLLENGEEKTYQWSKLARNELLPEADKLLLWLTRYSVKRNRPRAITGTVPVHTSGDAMTVMLDEDVPSVMQKLVVEGFTSAPVIDDKHRYVGFVTLLDICIWYLQSFGVWQSQEQVNSDKEVKSTDETEQVKANPQSTPNEALVVPLAQNNATKPLSSNCLEGFFQLEKFKNATVRDIIQRPNQVLIDSFPIPVYKGFSLFTVVELFARHGMHRVPVIDRENKVTSIVTQSMVMSLLEQNLHRMSNIGALPVRAIVPGLSSELVAVEESLTTFEAFYHLCDWNVTGIAVIDSDGALVDTLSVRDLRGMGPVAENFERLWLTVKEFKATCRQLYPSQTPASPIYVTLDDTIESVIRKMDDGNIHRIFVCDVDDKLNKPFPLHAISQRDIFRFLLLHMGLVPDTIDAEII